MSPLQLLFPADQAHKQQLNLFSPINMPGLSLSLCLWPDFGTQPLTTVAETPRTLNQAPPDKELPPPLCTWAPPSCSISGLDWASQGAGASPPFLWLIPSLHHLFPSSASDTHVKGNTPAWWIDLFMDASLPGRLLILQSAPVYLLFTRASVIQLRSERHPAPIEKSMSSSAYLEWEL